jgi:hypothetical protein
MHVLLFQRDRPLPGGVLLRESLQPVPYLSAVLLREQTAFRQHVRVRDGRLHVVGHEPIIQCVILSRRELKYTSFEWFTLVPESAHDVKPRK